MCGRFERSSSPKKIAEDFRVTRASVEIAPSYNIAPSRPVLIVKLNDAHERELAACTWGFLPSWAADSAALHPTINARAETVATKPLFRDAFSRHRCLIVANGFFEWQRAGKRKVPYYIHRVSGRPLGLAGIYSVRDGSAVTACTCAIITTEANDLVRTIHDRMPAIISENEEEQWLDPSLRSPDELLALLKPFPAELMAMHEVSGRVNYPAFDSPEAVRPVVTE